MTTRRSAQTPSRQSSRHPLRIAALAIAASVAALPGFAHAEKAYLEITLKVDAKDRAAAGAVYAKYKQPFLSTVPGAQSKELLVRDDDVQVLHGFASKRQAEAYLSSNLFTQDVVVSLKPLLKAAPEVRVYSAD